MGDIGMTLVAEYC